MKNKCLLTLTLLLGMLQPMFLRIYLHVFQAFHRALIVRVTLKATPYIVKPRISHMEEINNQQGIFISASYIVIFVL